MHHAQSACGGPNNDQKLLTETYSNEDRAMQNSIARPAKRTVLAPPTRRTMYLESNGLERSLSTNIPDHPTAIQVRTRARRADARAACARRVLGVGRARGAACGMCRGGGGMGGFH